MKAFQLVHKSVAMKVVHLAEKKALYLAVIVVVLMAAE